MMQNKPRSTLHGAALTILAITACPALAEGDTGNASEISRESAEPVELAVLAAAQIAPGQQSDRPSASATGAPAPLPFKSVFDDNWVNIGVGVGLIPTYAGSNDYFLFPVPLITGRLGGVGFRPSGAGMTFDVLSPQPTVVQRDKKPQVSFGPTFRMRVERSVDSRDEVVEAAGRLDTALELGLAGGVTFPAVLNDNDSVTLGLAARWDVLGAHKGRVIEPGVSYLTPLALGVLTQVSATAEIVDGNFARYYQSVTPDQSAASGLPVFNASGGLNRIGINSIFAFDLDGNALNGGFNIFTLAGYSRMLGDGARTPFTRERGSRDQFQLGLGVGYTF
jgi:MipA family protein